MKHMINGDNLAFLFGRQNKSSTNNDFLVTKYISEMKCAERTIQSYHCPLYLYPDENDLDQSRRVNMDPKIRAAIERAATGETVGDVNEDAAGKTKSKTHTTSAHPLGRGDPVSELAPGSTLETGSPIELGMSGGGVEMTGVTPPLPGPSTASIDPSDQSIGPLKTSGQPPAKPTEVDIFDYIYGVLHCPAYRETYAEFLKIDFPRIPYPSSPESFWDIAAKGGALRTLHLMDGVESGPHPFMGQGDSVIKIINAKSFKSEDGVNGDAITGDAITGDAIIGDIWVNDTQFFKDVPKIAWEFYIGGYQPAQKWLKDRKGRALSFEDILHYQKIIHILCETDRIMKTIEMDL